MDMNGYFISCLLLVYLTAHSTANMSALRRIISSLINWKEMWEKAVWPNLRDYPAFDWMD
jgi:hypothetical protein